MPHHGNLPDAPAGDSHKKPAASTLLRAAECAPATGQRCAHCSLRGSWHPPPPPLLQRCCLLTPLPVPPPSLRSPWIAPMHSIPPPLLHQSPSPCSSSGSPSQPSFPRTILTHASRGCGAGSYLCAQLHRWLRRRVPYPSPSPFIERHCPCDVLFAMPAHLLPAPLSTSFCWLARMFKARHGRGRKERRGRAAERRRGCRALWGGRSQSAALQGCQRPGRWDCRLSPLADCCCLQ